MKPAADILARLLEQKASEQQRSGSAVFRGWEAVAGAPLSDHSRVYELQHGQLCVEVDHPGWLQVLLLRQDQILRRLRRSYPQLTIRALRARVNLDYGKQRPAGGSGAPQAPGGPAEPGAGAAAAIEAEQAVAGVGPEELKVRLRRLFEASRKRASRESSRGQESSRG